MFSLAGKKALVIGIAKAFRAQGADLAITFQGKKLEAFVRPIAIAFCSRQDLHARVVGAYAAFFASFEAANVTGGVHYIDGDYHIVG